MILRTIFDRCECGHSHMVDRGDGPHCYDCGIAFDSPRHWRYRQLHFWAEYLYRDDWDFLTVSGSARYGGYQ
jgi:hypothetical protein